jgi:HAD superfamily hydrolase (TIGR01509 family)
MRPAGLVSIFLKSVKKQPGKIMRAIEAIIFDIDGTLVDSVDLHAQAWRETFQRFGRNILFEDIRVQMGKGADQLMPIFFSKDELNRFGKAMENYRLELFKRNYLPQVKAFPGVRELFQRILNDGKTTALASSSRAPELLVYKRIAEIEDLIQTEISADDVKHSKPCPDIFQAALKKLAISAGNIVAIGDAPYDAIAAKRAGIATIGVLCGGFGEEVLRAAGCIAIFDGPADLLEHYDVSPIHAGI